MIWILVALAALVFSYIYTGSIVIGIIYIVIMIVGIALGAAFGG